MIEERGLSIDRFSHMTKDIAYYGGKDVLKTTNAMGEITDIAQDMAAIVTEATS